MSLRVVAFLFVFTANEWALASDPICHRLLIVSKVSRREVSANVGRYSLGIAHRLHRNASHYRKQADYIRGLQKFRNLRGLYQFAINYSDENLTNRQMHSEDVAVIASELTRELGLSEASQSLAAVIGLAHDIGHPVFSHWGETALRKRLSKHGLVWDHDAAGLHVVTDWSSDPTLIGTEVLEGLAKRFWRFDSSRPRRFDNHLVEELPLSLRQHADFSRMNIAQFNHIEGQIAAQSDRIAFNATDIQDGLRVGRISPADLRQHFPSAFRVYQGLLRKFAEKFKQTASTPMDLSDIESVVESDPILRDYIFSQFAVAFRQYQMGDLLSTTKANIETFGINVAEQVRQQTSLTADFSENLKAEFRQFAEFSRIHLFAKTTAPFEQIVNRVIDLFLNEKAQMKSAYHDRFVGMTFETEKLILIAQYLTLELTDTAVLDLVLQQDPNFFATHFPGFEWIQVSSPLDDHAVAIHRLTQLMAQPVPVNFEKPDQDFIERYPKHMVDTGKNIDPLNPNSLDIVPTSAIYSHDRDSSGRRIYSPERTAIHEQIIQQALSKKVAVEGKRAFVSVAGGMSVGMTYLQRLLLSEGVLKLENTVVITPLSFMSLPEFAIRGHYQHPEKSPLLVEEYYDISRKIVEAAISKGLHIMYVDQADQPLLTLEFLAIAKRSGYGSAMLGLTMTSEAYYAASELWLHRFYRITDHLRGFGDLKEFALSWPRYTQAFDFTALFETYFHVEDIDRNVDDPNRKEYSVIPISGSIREHDQSLDVRVFEPRRFQDFFNRGRYLNADAGSPSEAVRDYPLGATETQIGRGQRSSPVNLDPSQSSELTRRLIQFVSGDFEARFVRLVQETTARRQQQARKRR
ncbi:MAG: HD domain-containing protein [Bdellovibrionales bacterium]|nr:HD domain-containing protein [Bdellovibrionales bacterium]